MSHTYLLQTELARRWRMSPRTLERWRWLGLGPRHTKIVGKVINRLEDMEAYEANSLRSSTSTPMPSRTA
jgi:hypothetical protein